MTTNTIRITIASQILAASALIAVLLLGLLPALLAGLLVYQLVEFGARRLSRIGVIPDNGRIILLLVVSLIFTALIALGIISLMAQFANGPEGMVALFQKMADVVDAGRNYLPEWVQQYMPSTIDEWQAAASNWLRHNASQFGLLGKEAGIFFVHIIIGMVVGGIVALDSKPSKRALLVMEVMAGTPATDPRTSSHRGPLASALLDRVDFLDTAFTRIVFSQVRISALNTALTAMFLLVVLPLAGSPLPFAKALVVLTFVVGLLPIIGNLISNTVIFLIGLSVSPVTAIAALSYLIVIHKLEYFINARIIGSRIKARAWEILISMLVMESAFGIAGLVAAPIYYAYLKDELAARKLI